LAASLGGEIAGPIRLYRNNPAADTDHDGLGDALEQELQTCESNLGLAPGWNCNDIPDTRDTDGDGLTDDWEVFGKWSSWSDRGVLFSEYLALPAWGANPRHKDIFIEVDFRRFNLADNQSGLALKMDPSTARQMAAAYADSATTNAWLRSTHAASVRNPDGVPGISLHFDTGLDPTDPADATVFGNWGGYNPVNAVQDAEGNWIPQRPEQVWQQQMSRGRWGVFHYVMAYPGSGGSCGQGIACGFSLYDVRTSAHEFGHTLGLHHHGPYTVNEPNCKPNYPSLMNYAFLDYLQFADGLNHPTLNNHSLTETNSVDPAQTIFLDVLESKFKYKIDRTSGSVDWNRDGSFAPAGTPVRAYANYRPGSDCEFTREDQKYTGLESERSPAMVYIQNRLFVFAIGLDGVVRYTYTNGPWICSPTVDHCPDPVFEAPFVLPVGQLVSVDARPYKPGGNLEQIIVTGIRTDGSLIENALTISSVGLPAWGATTVISGPSTAIGELSLAVSENRNSLAMAYKGPDHTVRIRYRSNTGWSAETQLKQAGQPIQMHQNTSPGLAYSRLPGGISLNETLVGAFADPQGYIQLYSPALFGTGWSRISVPYDSMYSAVGRPAIGWIGPPPTNSQGDGPSGVVTASRFYVLYLRYSAPPPNHTPTNPVRMAFSYVDANGTFRIGLDSHFDNVWAYGYGMGIMQPSSTKMRAVFTSAIPKPASLKKVFVRPHADGISDLTYRNYDDWKTLGWGTCATLAPTQSPAAVQCPAPW
jgi:hypothetical protein